MEHKLFTFIFAAMTMLFCGCTDDDNQVTPSQIENPYFPLTTGSTWTYEMVGKDKTILSKDSVSGITTINGRQYTNIYTVIQDPVTPYSYTESYRKSNDTLFLLNEGADITALISRKDAIWTASFSNPTFSQSDTSTIIESDIQHSVVNSQYQNVYHIRKTTTTNFQGQQTTSETHLYYAKNIGLIEQISPNVTVRLKSYSIK